MMRTGWGVVAVMAWAGAVAGILAGRAPCSGADRMQVTYEIGADDPRLARLSRQLGRIPLPESVVTRPSGPAVAVLCDRAGRPLASTAIHGDRLPTGDGAVQRALFAGRIPPGWVPASCTW